MTFTEWSWRLRGASLMSGRAAVIAVTSLALEARIASGPGVSVICNQASRLASSLEAAIERGACGIISFGIAGGLAPKLVAGDWVVGSAVRSRDARHPADARWARRLMEALPGAVLAETAGADGAIATCVDKRRLHEQTDTVAVDMESHIAARVAARHNIPFAICRTIIDAANRDLPPAALLELQEDGTADVLAILRSLARRPRQIPALARIAVEAWIAREALRHGRALLGPGLGCPFVAQRAPEVLVTPPMLSDPQFSAQS
jgi:hopanoid-associated phosphorylase